MSAAEPFFATRLPRLVMFDLDGTLVDSVPDLTAAVDSMLASLGRPPAGIEKVRQWIGNGARVLVRRALAGSIEHDGIGEEETEAALALFMEAYADSHALTEVYPLDHRRRHPAAAEARPGGAAVRDEDGRHRARRCVVRR